jgi:flagellar protein FlaG
MDIGASSSIGRPNSYPEVTVSQQEQGTVKHVPFETGSERKYTKAEIENEINGINKWLQTTSTHLKFNLHEGLNEYYVQVINDQTNEVIREIPSKKVMDMVAKMHELVGILIDERR